MLRPRVFPFPLALAVLVGSVLSGLVVRADEDFIRADSNTDGLVDIADPVLTLGYLFVPGQQDSAPCLDAMDANDDGAVGISDAVYTFTYLGRLSEDASDWPGLATALVAPLLRGLAWQRRRARPSA